METKKLSRVLHICNWYPNRDNPHEALWLQRHINALALHCQVEVWHVQVKPSNRLKYHKYKDSSGCQHRVLELPTHRWFIIELFTAWLLFWVLLFLPKKKYDLVNFHIAYPLLTYWGLLKHFVGKWPAVISEHWSAYRLNFGMPKSKKMPRIQRIFRHGFPLITVSKALRDDITAFVGNNDFKQYVLPNVVDTTIFSPNLELQETKEPIFFMVSAWATPKNPVLVIKAFALCCQQYPKAILRIGGYGLLLPAMEAKTKELGLEKNIQFLGRLNAPEIAAELQKASAFLHCSGYETFSVVCAEAISVGTPVIASKVGGIPEFINQSNGILLEEGATQTAWAAAMQDILANSYDRIQIAATAEATFSVQVIGKQYFQCLTEVLLVAETQDQLS